MTVIVAVRDDSMVCMACDSQVTNNGHKLALANPKVIVADDFLVGAEGDGALGQAAARVLEHITLCSPPLIGPSYPFGKWVASEFVPALRKECSERGLFVRRDDREQFGGTLLLAWGSEFVLIDSVGFVIVPRRRFAAIGSGKPEAMGAMLEASMPEYAHTDEAIAMAGVEAAIEMDDGCGPPVVVRWTRAPMVELGA